MNKLLLVSALICSTLFAETVPNEVQLTGSKPWENSGKRITGDEVSKVHNFKLSTSGWDLSYRPETIGSFFGLSDWTRLYYKEQKKGHGDNKKPKFIRIYGPDYSPKKVLSVEEWKVIESKKMIIDLKEKKFFYEEPNPEYEEYNFEWKVFSGTYKNIKIELCIYSDGQVFLYTDDGENKIGQELLDIDSGAYGDSEQRKFMRGVYEHNK